MVGLSRGQHSPARTKKNAAVIASDIDLVERFFENLIASEKGHVKSTPDEGDPPPLNHPADYVIRTWMNFYRHGIYPESGGYNDQDPELMDDWHVMNLYHVRVEHGIVQLRIDTSETYSLDHTLGG